MLVQRCTTFARNIYCSYNMKLFLIFNYRIRDIATIKELAKKTKSSGMNGIWYEFQLMEIIYVRSFKGYNTHGLEIGLVIKGMTSTAT